MKKILLSCLLAPCLATFSGCASDQPQTTSTTTTTEETAFRPTTPSTTTTQQTTVQPTNQ